MYTKLWNTQIMYTFTVHKSYCVLYGRPSIELLENTSKYVTSAIV